MDFLRRLSELQIVEIWNFAFLLWFCKTCLAQCPADVHAYANNCFVGYNTQLHHMQINDRPFFAGVDVENLRQLCSKYRSAVLCILNLHKTCTEDQYSQVDVTKIVSFDGAQTDLSELCKDDKILEVYARYQNCFIIHGKYSERCFERAMALNVSSIKDVNTKPLNTFCSDMKSLNSCITTNILLKCGKEAAESLVDILIRASLRRSTECSQTVPFSTSSSGSSNQNSNNKNRSNSGKSLSLNSIHTPLILSLVFLVLKHSIRL